MGAQVDITTDGQALRQVDTKTDGCTGNITTGGQALDR
jgi:hypothetical protein